MTRRAGARLALGVGAWAAIIVVARVWGERSIAEVRGVAVGAAPLVGRWDWHPGRGIVFAAGFAAGVVAFGPGAARRLAWRWVIWGAGAVAAAWTLLLAAADGWSGIADPLATRYEYLAVLDQISSPGDFLSTFTERAAGYPTHVKGHPPGSPLVFWALDRVGLSGPGWAAALIVVAVALMAVAVLDTVDSVAGRDVARRAAPFVALAPAAVWAGFSNDPLYGAVVAVGTACIARAAAGLGGAAAFGPERARAAALGPTGGAAALGATGGAVLGLALHLSYGAAPLLAIGAAVIGWRRAWATLGWACAGAAAVTAIFVAGGFWWFDGLSATREFYEAGVASRRPYGYFVLAGNPAALALAVGPATAAGLATLRDRRAWLLVGAATAAVAAANLSGLSKGEVERIWLPFTPWLLVAASSRSVAGLAPRGWLAAQAALALWLQAALISPW